MKKEIDALILKAADAHDSGDAMRYSQAAVNAANAYAVIAEMARNKRIDKREVERHT